MALKYFGTDGVRGVVGGPVLNEEWIRRFGYALGTYGVQVSDGKPFTVVVGYDTRESSPWICELLMEGLNASQGLVYALGVVPTPAVALNVIERHSTLGIVITASHNPASDNGIKIFDSQGHKLAFEEELKIERFLETIAAKPARTELRRTFPHDGEGTYINRLCSYLHQKAFRGMKVVLDCSHGATYKTSPAVLKHLGVEVIVLNDQPDGNNINAGVGSEHPDGLASAVLEHHADLGIAHDGDGDRVVFCAASGAIIDGDQILGVLAMNALKTHTLLEDTLVTTVQSNLGLDQEIARKGGKVSRTDVGDRNVAARMRELGASLGGENSGHIILAEYSTTGDGLLAAVEILKILDNTQQTLDELAAEIPLFPQITGTLNVERKPALPTLLNLQACLKESEQSLAGQGRIMIRYSGTEPKLRLLVEANSREVAQQIFAKLRLSAEKDFLEKA